jgi:hypothetical protein
MPDAIDPNHDINQRRMSKTAFVLLGIGVPCGLLGVIFFISVFFTERFIFAPIGLVMAAVGGFASMFGLQLLTFSHAGKIARYQAAEMTPVGKDVVRDVLPVASDAVRELAAAAREGLTGVPAAKLTHTCGTQNDADDRFCKGCGQPLDHRKCPKCAAANDADARFCDTCGYSLA